MKKVNAKQVFGVLKRLLVMAFAILLLVVLPAVKLSYDDNLSMIYSTFLGSKSKYQGIIEIWNIDSFESGTASKTSFINSIAKSFQNKNKGLYVMVRNLSQFECENLLAQGQKPDLFSCSYGVALGLKDYIQPFDNRLKFDTASNFLSAGMVDSSLMAVAWCRGNYCLISTKGKIESAQKAGAFAGFDFASEQSMSDEIEKGKRKLSDIALLSGYKVQEKNSTKTIYSLEVAKSKYQLPQIAFEAYTNKGLVSISDVDFDQGSISQSQYSAYSNFIAGNSTVLLGTQRDIARMQNRESLGKVSDVIYEPVTGFTDLVQFMLVAQSNDVTRREYAEKFAQFLTSESSQSKLSLIGMFATCNLDINLYENSVMSDISSQKIGDYKVNKLF